MRILKLFSSLKFSVKLIFIESYFCLAWARILKALPFYKVAPTLGKQKFETAYEIEKTHRETLANISQAVQIMSSYTFWESQCLVKAMAAMRMLSKRNIGSTLYLGTGKDEQGKLMAHAWLRSGPYYITGAEEMEQFTVVQTFAKDI